MWSGSPCPRRVKRTSLWRTRVAIIRSRLNSYIGGNHEGYVVILPGGKVGFPIEELLMQFFKGNRCLSCLNSIGKFFIVRIKTIKNLDGKILDVNWGIHHYKFIHFCLDILHKLSDRLGAFDRVT